MASNPGSSFRGLQESIIAYGSNSKPEFLTCLHEESAVAMSHGYAKIAYKPMSVACHGTVGLQHAAMAVYNAYCDRVPIIIFAGNHMEATGRRPGAEWAHAAQDCAKLVRDFTKWDDIPLSLTHFAESLVRAYKIATTPPMGPVVIVLDGHLQEEETNGVVPPIPPYTPTTPPQGEGLISHNSIPPLLWWVVSPSLRPKMDARRSDHACFPLLIGNLGTETTRREAANQFRIIWREQAWVSWWRSSLSGDILI